MRFRAVIFDLGGVVAPAPMDAFRAYEARVGLPHRFISEVIVRSDDTGAWNRLERGELSLDEFSVAFEVECATAGHSVPAADMLGMLQGTGGAHQEMLEAIHAIRAAGLRTAALTNNWVVDDPVSSREPLFGEHFDVVIESSVVGLRKPDPKIYELVLGELDVDASDTVYLDDLGVNLKPAREMGMTTIKVTSTDQAISDLSAALGIALRRERD